MSLREKARRQVERDRAEEKEALRRREIDAKRDAAFFAAYVFDTSADGVEVETASIFCDAEREEWRWDGRCTYEGVTIDVSIGRRRRNRISAIGYKGKRVSTFRDLARLLVAEETAQGAAA